MYFCWLDLRKMKSYSTMKRRSNRCNRMDANFLIFLNFYMLSKLIDQHGMDEGNVGESWFSLFPTNFIEWASGFAQLELSKADRLRDMGAYMHTYTQAYTYLWRNSAAIKFLVSLRTINLCVVKSCIVNTEFLFAQKLLINSQKIQNVTKKNANAKNEWNGLVVSAYS